MKKFILLLLLIPSLAFASPPSRVHTYVAGSTILSQDVTENEDQLFNYLQAGVDFYAPLSISNADISTSANIQSDKINLESIGQAVAISIAGSFDNDGTTSLDGVVGISGALTVTGVSTFAGTTITDLGTVTTANIDGGTLDNVQIGGTTATGELFVNDSSDYADGLGSQGTSGQFLKSRGSGVYPTWSSLGNVEVFTSSGNYTVPIGVNYISVSECGGGAGGTQPYVNSGNYFTGAGGGAANCIIDHVLKVTPSSIYSLTIGAGGAAGIGNSQLDAGRAGSAGGATSFVGDQYTLTAAGGGAPSVNVSTGASTGGTGATGNTSLNAVGDVGGLNYSYAGGNGDSATTSATSSDGGGGASYMAKGGSLNTSGAGLVPGPGAGGAGGYGAGSGITYSAAAGGPGIIIIKYNVNGTPI